MEVAGRVAVVTGGASGIGAAVCDALAAAGADVAVADIDGDGARATAERVGGIWSRVDVAVEADVMRFVAKTEDELGPVDLFFANAGIAIEGDPWTSDADWQRIWEVNTLSHVYASRAVLPGMLERRSGYLIHTASAAGLLNQLGSAPYAVTKSAVVAFAEWLAITYGDRGLKVSVLAPQAVRTKMTENMGSGPLSVAAVDGMMEPEEVAGIVLEGIAAERFLILPHPDVADYIVRKATDYDRWLAGMRRLQARLTELAAEETTTP
jgi:NAD(P)-dependent dehydrogenase (short-subunit alcohol dehydrogenase family)